jgi:hypothetical protein
MIGCRRWFVGGTKNEHLPHDCATGDRRLRGAVLVVCDHKISRFPPKVAVIQCGADNPYGHPTPETLDRLQRVGAKVFRNDEDGDVIATIKDQELKVATTKR